MQIEWKLLSPEMVSGLDNKELLSHVRVYKKMQQVRKRAEG